MTSSIPTRTLNPAMIEPSSDPLFKGCRKWTVNDRYEIICLDKGMEGVVLGVYYVREHQYTTDPLTLQKNSSGGVMSRKNIYYRPIQKFWEYYSKAMEIIKWFNENFSDSEIPIYGIRRWFRKQYLKYMRQVFGGNLSVAANVTSSKHMIFLWLIENGWDWEKIKKVMRMIKYNPDPRIAYNYVSWKQGGETYWKTLRRAGGTRVYSKVKPVQYNPVSVRFLRQGLRFVFGR